MSETQSLLRISAVQTDIIWENKSENLRRLHPMVVECCGKTDVVVLPEMFSTGFSMKASQLAEPIDGETLTTLRKWAAEYKIALAGSYVACERKSPSSQEFSFFNRAFFISSEGNVDYIDKRHLFRMGREGENYTAGSRHACIPYKGWNIRLLVCYDLRFPVWSRNVDNEYDLLIYVANWPSSRRKVWDILLQARALENQCYLCGVNRIGTDGESLLHDGGSIIYSPKGEALASVPDNKEGIATATLDLAALRAFREKFPSWKDADNFTLE